MIRVHLYWLPLVACFLACSPKKNILQGKRAAEQPNAITSPTKNAIFSTTTGPLPEGKTFPSAPREFRAAWIATVANINWPSKPGLSSEEQQKEALLLLDYLQEHHFNAAIFQVRPQADALYYSQLEPWSYFLTGEQGKAPEPYYDPLEFWIQEAHKRGIELHVWLNPYRAHHPQGQLNKKVSLVERMPGSVLHLAEGYWWFDPSRTETQRHALAVVEDLTRRYDIDGLHFDDYFYPYESYNKGADFPDQKSYTLYQQQGGQLTIGDWRRAQVDVFIQAVYKSIKSIKRHVKFGISPFGIWRPGYPEGIAGMDQYDKLYADARKWINEGWVDYLSPQLYWPINQYAQSFPVLLSWWDRENIHKRHLWPGMNVGRGGDEKNADEIINQIQITRGLLRDHGAIHWSISSLTKHPLLSKSILEGPYQNEALVPESPWLSTGSVTPSPKATLAQTAKGWTIEIEGLQNEDVKEWVLYVKYPNNANWQFKRIAKGSAVPYFDAGSSEDVPERIGLTSIDRNGKESAPLMLK